MATPKTVAFHTLGCKLNFSESSALARQFERAGYAVSNTPDLADIFVLNTCSVTDFADSKCRNQVRKVLRKNPQTYVVVVGCYAQLKPKEIAEIQGVDLVLGAAEKFNILEYIDDLSKAPGKGMIYAGEIQDARTFIDAFSFGDRTRSFLKVQDGCDYKCTFCTIPMARGSSRSDTIDKVVHNATTLAGQGVKEIVLTGVNIGDFGNGTEIIEGSKPKKNDLFIDLIRELDKVEDIDRFRISSIEPNLCTDEIIDFVAGSKRFLPHFHMPLQSGSDAILSKMRRRYKTALYESRVKRIKQLMPKACIGVDVIVGFPGENDQEFLKSKQFISSLPVSYLHVFTYSERPNTLAENMQDKVPMHIRKERNHTLRRLSEVKRRKFYQDYIGAKAAVLFEKSKQPGTLTGFTRNYIKIELQGPPELIGQSRIVTLNELNENGHMNAMLTQAHLCPPV